MRKFIANWTPVILCSTILLYLCTTEIKTEVEVPYLDKIAHLAFYAVYAFLLMRALVCSTGLVLSKVEGLEQYPPNILRASGASRERVRRSALIAVSVSALYGGGIEWIQYYIPGRSASFGDEAANIIGAIIGVGVFIAMSSPRRRGSSLDVTGFPPSRE